MPRRIALALATAIIVLSTFLSPWSRELFVGDETKYAEIVREMRSERSFLVPLLNGAPYSHKPPIHFWIMNLLSRPFGVFSIWPYVLPSLVAFVAMLFLVKRISREFFPSEEGSAMAAFILASSWLVWGLAQTARMDLTFVFFVSLSAFLLWKFLESTDPIFLYRAATAAAIAILIKGPMGAVIPLLLLIFQTLRRKRLPQANYLIASAIVVVIPLLWVVPAIMRGGQEFGEEILIKQNVGRAFGSWVHKSPPWFYLVRAPLTFFPWFFLALLAIVALYRSSRPVPSGESPSGSRTGRRSDYFCIDWILAVLVPFSLISGKLDVYMLPALPPLALLIGKFLADPPSASWSRAAVRMNLLVSSLVAVVAGAALLVGPSLVKRPHEKALMTAAPVRVLLATTLIAAIIGIAVQITLRPDKLRISTLVAGLVSITPLVALSLLLLPIANENLSTAPLVKSLERQGVGENESALFACPFLWVRNLPKPLRHVRYIAADEIAKGESPLPIVVATRSTRAHELGSVLFEKYEKKDEVRIKGMQFDVYRLR